jgi:proton-translocating NADH-quinone oxidoreductase chain M
MTYIKMHESLFGINFTLPFIPLGIDGLSVFFVLLVLFLIPICLIISENSIKKYHTLYVLLFLFLQLILVLVFMILDIFLFYVLFEAVLAPMYLIIGVWGSRERRIKASYHFFLYTLFGSLFMLIGIASIKYQIGSTHILEALMVKYSYQRQLFIWLSFFLALGIKVPMVPAHLWLPEAHVEAPTSGSVLLAGILLKLGTYGFLRFLIPLFPYASIYFSPFVYMLCIIGIVYISLTTLRQIDLKKIIAYSSIAHMNFAVLGIFSFNLQGIEGSLFLMISHGIVSSALFICVGILYDRYHTRILAYYGGLAYNMPIFSFFFFLFTLANLSLPGTSSFIGEFLIILGIFQTNTFVTCMASLSIVIGAIYSIWLFNRLAFGPLLLPV